MHWPVIGGAVEFYRILTGADRGFGFFAPRVIGEPIIKIEVTDSAGNVTPFDPAEGVSREAELRISSALGAVASYFKDPSVRQSVSASIAGHVMNQSSGGGVTITWEHHEVPTMRAYREGERPQRQELYRATFLRHE